MNETTNLYVEEYRALQAEAAEFTSDNYRDLQVVVAVLTSAAAIGGITGGIPSNTLLVGFLHLAVFVVLLVQVSRLAHLMELQRHLATLETQLDDSGLAGRLTWNRGVPAQALGVGVVAFQTKIALGLTYVVAFVAVGVWASRNTGAWWHAASFAVEAIVLLYLFVRLAVQFRSR